MDQSQNEPDQMTGQDSEPSTRPKAYREIYTTARDGLKLYARDYGPRDGHALPVICLHGFSRNSADFEDVAEHLSKTRRVIVPDLRGRGKSEYARHWSSYTLANELLDILDLTTVCGIHHAVFFGYFARRAVDHGHGYRPARPYQGRHLERYRAGHRDGRIIAHPGSIGKPDQSRRHGPCGPVA